MAEQESCRKWTAQILSEDRCTMTWMTCIICIRSHMLVALHFDLWRILGLFDLQFSFSCEPSHNELGSARSLFTRWLWTHSEKTDVQQSASNVHTEASKSMQDLRIDRQTSRHRHFWLCTFSGQWTDGPYRATSGRMPRGLCQTVSNLWGRPKTRCNFLFCSWPTSISPGLK